MRESGICTRHKRRYKVTTDSKHGLPVADNLLDRNFTPAAPNQVWTSDITYEFFAYITTMQKSNRRIKQIRLTKRESIRLAESVDKPPSRNELFKVAQARYQEMKLMVGIAHITPVGGNVFLDLGFPPEVAAQLKADADATIQDNIPG